MITTSSRLFVLDNTGALEVECIKVLTNVSNIGSIGDTLLVSIKRCKAHKRVKRSELYKAVLVQTKKEMVRGDGTSLSFGENCVVLVNNKKIPIGSRVFGAMPFEIKGRGFHRVFALAGLGL